MLNQGGGKKFGEECLMKSTSICIWLKTDNAVVSAEHCRRTRILFIFGKATMIFAQIQRWTHTSVPQRSHNTAKCLFAKQTSSVCVGLCSILFGSIIKSLKLSLDELTSPVEESDSGHIRDLEKRSRDRYREMFNTNTTLTKIIWRLESRQSFALNKLITRNGEIERRLKAGRDVSDIMPGATPVASTPVKEDTVKEELHRCFFFYQEESAGK